MRKKLLVIPSWYPTKENPSIGSFFKEQAELMSENFEVRVLIGNANLIGRKKYLTSLSAHKNQSKCNQISKAAFFSEYSINYNDIVFLKTHKRLKRIAKAYNAVLKEFKKEAWVPDIIHAQSVINAGFIANYLGDKYKVPVLLTIHTPILATRKTNDFLRILNSTRYISTVSEYAQRMILINFPSKKVFVHGNLVDESKFTEVQSSEKNKLNIGFIGNPFHGKDPTTLIEAISKIKIPLEVNFLMPSLQGDFSVDEIKEVCKRKGILKLFKFNDEIVRNDITEFYQNQNLIISTSISETFGLVIAEALMCGVPVIATDNGGVRDIIEDGKNGIIVNLKDSNAIAEYILKIYNKEITFDPEKLRASIVSKFGREAFLAKMTSIYDEIIEQHHVTKL